MLAAPSIARLVGSLALGVLASAGLGSVASATGIQAGFDLFQTVPGTGGGASGSSVDLGGLGLGIVDVQGVPFGPGNTDTIVERLAAVSPAGGITEIELVALHLTSVSPVDLTPLGLPGVLSDLHFTINAGGIIPGLPQPDALNPSRGLMEITHLVADGGEWDACFGTPTDPNINCNVLGVPGGGIYADLISVVVGGDPANPLDRLFPPMPAPRIALSADNFDWSHTAPSNYPIDPSFPAGGFYPMVVPGSGGQVIPEIHDGPHVVLPAVPEPHAVGLLALGGAALALRMRRRA